MGKWYVRRGEKVLGPIESSQLRASVEAGKLLPSDLIAKDAGGPWTPLSKTSLLPATSSPSAKPPAVIIKSTQVAAPGQSQPEPPVAPKTGVLRATQTALSATERRVVAIAKSMGGVLAARAARKHELHLAKIQAQTVIASGKISAATSHQATAQPASTVVNVVNTANAAASASAVAVVKEPGGCASCLGCLGVIVLLIILIAVFSPKKPDEPPQTPAPNVTRPTDNSTPAVPPAVEEPSEPEPVTPPATTDSPEGTNPVVDRTEELATKRLDLAKQFIERGKKDEAAQWLRRLLSDWPETKAAVEAQALMESLKK